MATLKSLCSNVKCESKFGAKLAWDKQSKWQQESNGFTVTLRYQRRSMTIDFWQGTGIQGDPDADDVLECLLSDANAGENDFESFCSELGSDSDSRQAYATWEGCKKTGEKLRRLLGDDFDTFMNSER